MNRDLTIITNLEALARFRFLRAKECPEDVRNHNAAVYCQALADAIRALGPDHPIIQRYHALENQFVDKSYQDGRRAWWQERKIWGSFLETGFARGETKTVVCENEAVDYVMNEITDLEAAIAEWEAELREDGGRSRASLKDFTRCLEFLRDKHDHPKAREAIDSLIVWLQDEPEAWLEAMANCAAIGYETQRGQEQDRLPGSNRSRESENHEC